MDPRSGALDALHHHQNHTHALSSTDQLQHPHSQHPHLLPSSHHQQQQQQALSQNHSALYRVPHHYPQHPPPSNPHIPYNFPANGATSSGPQLSAYLRQHPQPLDPRHFPGRPIPHLGLHPSHHLNHRLSTTCIPSLIPPGMDPGQVDMRTFFPYQPNEVKHRKRTTRSQLKVLEDVYKYDTKPNASLRKKLAEELGMTPRGVQVWFQNRRAKTKSQARKAEAAKKQNGEVVVGSDKSAAPSSPTDASSPAAEEPFDDDVPASSPTPSASNPSTSSSLDTPNVPSEMDETQSISSGSNTITDSPTIGPLETITRETGSPVGITASNPGSTSVPVMSGDMVDASSIWTCPDPFGTPSTPTPSAGEGSLSTSQPSTPDPSSSFLCVPDAHLLNQRRPSLPIINASSQQGYHHLPQFPHRSSASGAVPLGLNGARHGGAPYNLMNRRRSVDTNMLRLGAHPYAPLARHANGYLYAGVPPHVNPVASATHLVPEYDISRLRRGSMPHALAPHNNTTGPSPQQQLMYSRPQNPTRMSMPTLAHQQQDYSTPTSSYGPPPHVQVSPPPQQPPTITSSGSTYEYPSISQNGSAVSAPAPHTLSGSNSQPTSPSTSSPPSSISFPQMQHGQSMVYSSREIEQPPPGPLPPLDYTFGNASLVASESTSVHSTPPGSGMQGQGQESEDDGTTSVGTGSSYDQYGSRFGSLASIASIGSESSFTSAYYSTEENATGTCEDSLAPGYHPDIRRGSVAGPLAKMFGDLDVNGNTSAVAQMTSHVDVRRASSSSSGGSAPISPVHDGSSPSSNHVQVNNGLSGASDVYSSPGSTISASSHKGMAVSQVQVNEMNALPYGYHHHQAPPLPSSQTEDIIGVGVGVGMQSEGASSLMYPSVEYPDGSDPTSVTATGQQNGNSSEGHVHFTNPFGTETGATGGYGGSPNDGYTQHYTGMEDTNMEVPPHQQPLHHHHQSQPQQQQQQSGNEPLYGTGAIELSHMCVPAPMGAMNTFGMVDSAYLAYP